VSLGCLDKLLEGYSVEGSLPWGASTNRQAEVIALADVAHSVNVETSIYCSLSYLRCRNSLQAIRRDLDCKGNDLTQLAGTTLRDLDARTIGPELN
jgi:hypothetical protein